MIRVRFAPSPTGLLHIGTARTALFNILFGRHSKGTVVFRIEDTDTARNDPAFEKDIIDGLTWLGMKWDEGPDVGGPHAPYRQSERLDHYLPYLQTLLDQNKLYHCFCTQEDLEAARQHATDTKTAPIYNGRCATLTPEEVSTALQAGKPSTLRFRVPSKVLRFRDLIRGDVEFDTALIGDIIIAKDLNSPLYNFVVVIDDHEMEITHVVRGEDHISNTPKQMLIMEALGFTVPIYAHLPLILSTTGKGKMSKRKDPVSITRDFRDKGYLPEAMVNYLALLGWNPGTEEEIFTLDQIIEQFSFERVSKSGAVFNPEKLEWLNSHYIRALSSEDITKRTLPFLVEQGYIDAHADNASEYRISGTGETISLTQLEQYVTLEQTRAKILSEIPSGIALFLADQLSYESNLLLWKETPKSTTREMLILVRDILDGIEGNEYTISGLETVIKAAITEKGLKNGAVLWPLRVSLSGLANSPGPFEIAQALGKIKTLRRVDHAITLLKEE